MIGNHAGIQRQVLSGKGKPPTGIRVRNVMAARQASKLGLLI